MSNSTLNTLLKDYERKRERANSNFEKEKLEFYNSHPELADLKFKLGKLALEISKAVLNQDTDLEQKLKNEFNQLSKQKEQLLNSLEIPKRSYFPHIRMFNL